MILEFIEGFFKILSAILGLGILVFFHELGHFVMAKIFKMKVEAFSVGMGPAIFKTQRGDTVFQIGAVPFGGFCKFKGEELADLDDESAAIAPDSFYGTPAYKRLFVAFCGPFMNYIIAIVFLTILAMGGHKELAFPAKVILAEDLSAKALDDKMNPAKKAGILSGDIILKIDGNEISKYSELSKYLIVNEKEEYNFTIKRGDKIIEKVVKPEWDPKQLKQIIGVICFLDPVIKNNKDSVLNKELGLIDGDVIIGIDNDYSNMATFKIASFLESHFSTDKKSVLHVKRGNKIVDIPLIFNDINHRVTQDKFYLDFDYDNYKTFIKGKNFIDAMGSSFKDSIEMIQITMIGLYSLIAKPKDKEVMNQIGGPIMIGNLIGNVTVDGFKEGIYEGLRRFFESISLISLLLGVFNLLPIPALDGGHIIISLFQIVTRKEMTIKMLKVLYKVITFFFVVLMAFAVIVAFFDIFRLLGK